MKPTPRKQIDIQTADNGWIIHLRDPDFPHNLSPCYVFNDAREMANAVHELAERGTLDAPIFSGSGLPGDPVRCVKPFSEIVETHANLIHEQ